MKGRMRGGRTVGGGRVGERECITGTASTIILFVVGYRPNTVGLQKKCIYSCMPIAHTTHQDVLE